MVGTSILGSWNGHWIMEKPIIMDDLGVPPFRVLVSSPFFWGNLTNPLGTVATWPRQCFLHHLPGLPSLGISWWLNGDLTGIYGDFMGLILGQITIHKSEKFGQRSSMLRPFGHLGIVTPTKHHSSNMAVRSLKFTQKLQVERVPPFQSTAWSNKIIDLK